MTAKRNRAGAKKLEMGVLRSALADGRVWTGMGVVKLFPGESAHYLIDTSAGIADVMVDVELSPNGERLVCRLGSSGGVWRIPPVGAEVAVIIPEGDFDADAIIVAELAPAAAPPSGLAATVMVIQAPSGGQILIHDGVSGDAVSLARKSDVDDMRTFLRAQFDIANGHKHADSSPPATTGTGTGVGYTVPTPVGTSVLKAK